MLQAPATQHDESVGARAPFNVEPCRRDPVCALLRLRWGLGPGGGALLFLIVFLGGNFLMSAFSGTAFPRPGLDQAFVQDTIAWLIYGLIVPAAALLALRFYAQVGSTFERLYADGVVQAPLGEYNRFLDQLHRRYNAPGVHVGVLAMAAAIYGFMVYHNQHDSVRAWLDWGMGIGAAYQLAVGIIPWYSALLLLVKAVVTGRAMQRVFDWPVNIQPLHPDGCGGLRLLTDISVTIALFTALLALAMVLFIRAGTPLVSIPVAAALSLMVLTPVAFAVCLHSAHRAMARAKSALLARVSQQAQPSYQALCEGLYRGEAAEAASEEILRLDALHAFVRRLPVWPINTEVTVQVLLSIALPLALLVLQVVVERAVE
ncbi:MAG: hypothetical protein HY321_10525 [Armatimonadetes bacterium]|nr:hypothetical protein [Armatimonadota bacterium]